MEESTFQKIIHRLELLIEIELALGEFNAVALKTYLEGIEDRRDRLEKGEIDRDNTLFIARDYENTLVEKQFHRAVKSVEPEFVHLTEKN